MQYRQRSLLPRKRDSLTDFLFIADCALRHGGHVGGQEQKHFSPVGTKVYFYFLDFLFSLAPKRAKQLSMATILLCFEFFRCRVDVLQS